MNAKNFLGAGIAGGITDFLLGWLFYGFLLKDYFKMEHEPKIGLIALGCLSFGMLVSYIYVRWANLVSFSGGAKAGLVIGLFYGITMNAFYWSSAKVVNYELFAADVVVGLVIGALVGGVVALVNGLMSPRVTT